MIRSTYPGSALEKCTITTTCADVFSVIDSFVIFSPFYGFPSRDSISPPEGAPTYERRVGFVCLGTRVGE